MNPALLLKSALVASPFEAAAKNIQYFISSWKHPELTELFLSEKQLPLVLSRLLKRDSSIVDLGCHIGSFLSIARHHAPDGKFCAIEASPDKVTRLRKKFPGVRVEQVAISNFKGVAEFEDNLDNPGFSRLRMHNNNAGTDIGRTKSFEVPVTTLDALNLGHVDFLKVDVEGAEVAALDGGRDIIRSSRPTIMFECCTGESIPERRALFDLFAADMGYDVYTFTDFLFGKGPLSFDEFRKCGIYPYRAFDFLGVAR